VRDDAAKLMNIDDALERRIQALVELARELPLADQIDVSEVLAAERLGPPWNLLTPISEELLRLVGDPLRFAHDVVYPDGDLRWRLFHLGVYGEVLAEFADSGWHLEATAPLAGSSSRPAHIATRGDFEDRVHLWFEATGAWRYYGGPDVSLIYVSATQSSRSSRQSLSPDCLIVRVRPEGEVTSAAALECKYSSDPGYTVRDGYLQSLGYGFELMRLLKQDVQVFTVGPSSLVDGLSSSTVISAEPDGPSLAIGLCDPTSLRPALYRELSTSGVEVLQDA